MSQSTPPAAKPFAAQPFSSLPEQPRRPHGYAQTEAHTVAIQSSVFGAAMGIGHASSSRRGTIDVHYRAMGALEAPPLLLIHGLMTSSYSFRYVFQPLAERYRVIAPDLPGCGQSPVVAQPLCPSALAKLLSEFVDALGIRGSAAVGNSMGGYLAMHAALDDPELFAQLVNVHSPGAPEPRIRALSTALSIPYVPNILARVVRAFPERWAHKNVHYFDESLKSLEEAKEYGAPLADSEGARAFVSYLKDTMAFGAMESFWQRLEHRRDKGRPFPIPLCLMYARQDPMVPPWIGESLARMIPDAELIWLENTSHFPHVDTPRAFVDATLRALDRAS